MSSKHIKSMLKEIREDIRNKNFKVAIKKCEEVLEEDPNNFMAFVFLGAAYQEKDKTRAANYLRKAITCGGDTIIPLQGLLNCAEYNELPEILSKLLKLVPQKFLEYHNKLTTICINSNLNDCIEILKNETELENENDESLDRINSAWKCIAKILITRLQIPNELEVLFERSLQVAVNDENLENHLEYGRKYLKLLYKLNKYNVLLEQSGKLYEKYPNNVIPLEWICKVYCENYQIKTNTLKFQTSFFDNDNDNKTIDYYCDELLKLNKNSIYGLFVKSIQFYKNQDYIQSRNLLLEIKSLHSSNNTTINNINNILLHLLAENCIKIGAYNMAADIFNKLKIKTIQYGTCLSHSKIKTELNESINILENFLQNNKGNNDDIFDITSSIIRAYVNAHEIDKAREILVKNNNLTDEQKLLLNAEYFMDVKDAINELENFSFSINDKFQVYFLKGKFYLLTQEYEKSLENLILATKQRPYYSDCFMLLGEIYLYNNDLIRSRKCFEKCVKLNPQNETSVTNLSGIYRKLEEWNLNSDLLENTVKSFDGNCSWALFQLGLHYLNINEYEQATRALQKVVRTDLNNTIYWETLADAYQQRGSYNSAMKVNEKILELDNSNLVAKLQLATLKNILRMYKAAIEQFDEILNEKPDFIPAIKGIADAHYGMAQNLMSMRLLGRCKDHLQKAINYLQKAFLVGKRDVVWLWRLMANIFVMIGCFPESKKSLYVLGQLAGQEENMVEIQNEELFKFAEKFYIFALKLKRNDHLLWYELALCHYYNAIHCGSMDEKLNHFKSSIESCKQAICLQSSRSENWNLLGVIFTRKEIKNLPLSQHCFIKALYIDKRSAVTWSNLGALYLSLGDIKLANHSFRKAQQSNPDYLNAWIGQAIIAEQIGENDEAMDLFRHCTQLGFNLESAISYAYWVCTTLSDSEKMKSANYEYAIVQMHAVPVALDAITWYFNVNEINSSVEALSYLGYLNYKQSLWKPAIKAYKIAVKQSKTPLQKDEMLCNLGYTYLKNNQLLEAIEAFMEIDEATLNSTVGLALAHSKVGNMEESYLMYTSVLQWLASSEVEKSIILMEIASIAYSFEGLEKTRLVLYQLLELTDKPIEALYFACALGIIHKDWELTDVILDELKNYESIPDYSHHIAFLNACYYSENKQPKKGLLHLLKHVHLYPDQPLLRKVLAEYLLTHSSKTKKQLHKATSQIAQSIIPLGIIRATTSTDAARALTVASVAAGNVDVKKQSLLAQSAIHIHPTYEEAWISLKSCQTKCQ